MVRSLKAESFYSDLKAAAAAASSSPLLIFPSASDTDSLCSLKIITHILSTDSILFSVYPVASFADIAKNSLLSSHKDQNLCLLLINWGSTHDLNRILDLRPDCLTRVFVVDSHRPVHLHNLSEQNDRVVVLYTADDENQADLSYDFEISAVANCSNLESDDELEEDSSSDSESESDSDLEEDAEGRRTKRRRVSQDAESDPVRFYRRLKREYYKIGTFHGKPSGCLLFELAHSLRKSTNDLLWLACVSLTDQFVHERLTNERYQASVMELEQHINSYGNLETVSQIKLKDGTIINAPENSRIAYEDEPRLILLREWSLFDSMFYSSYIATKLRTWSDNGLKKLKLLLARMGFPLMDCQKKFLYMSKEVKTKMRDEFQRFLPEYGLTDLYYRSFMRVHGFGFKLSAADVVYGVTALLESKTGSFWGAYSALSLNNLDKLKKGMELAIEVQRAILSQGSKAITKSGFIRSGRKFRWVKLEDPVDVEKLGHPLALTKFSYFLLDALKERGAKVKPLICCCMAKEVNRVLVVGVCNKPRIGAVKGNEFGVVFKAAAQEFGAESFEELFESSCIVIDALALGSFMIRLTEML
ncbi:Cell division control protein 45 [Rhynchospora pubera]|uniref:Cell division control protein 45 n=1 Tax=Rhynchospora pubera TaxID=906938 RepID=A0AAV8EPS6_9POAL|nr:Cell division control protein 45 [Rhynchospora pubera]